MPIWFPAPARPQLRECVPPSTLLVTCSRAQNAASRRVSESGSAPVCRIKRYGHDATYADPADIESRPSTRRCHRVGSALQPRDDVAGDDLDLLVLVFVGNENKLLRSNR